VTPGAVLLEALSRFLRDDLQGELQGFKAYQNRVAANLLDLLAREAKLGEVLAALDRSFARERGLDETAMPAALARALRDGIAEDDARLRDYLKQRSLLALAIDNPRYSSFFRARERWVDVAAAFDALIEQHTV
jgi:hypothetical protein